MNILVNLDSGCLTGVVDCVDAVLSNSESYYGGWRVFLAAAALLAGHNLSTTYSSRSQLLFRQTFCAHIGRRCEYVQSKRLPYGLLPLGSITLTVTHAYKECPQRMEEKSNQKAKKKGLAGD